MMTVFRNSLLLLIALVLFLMAGCESPRGVFHTVKRGQTLYSIGRAYQVDPTYLARLNGVGSPDELVVGKRIWVPGAVKSIDVAATALSPTPSPPPVQKIPSKVAATSTAPVAASSSTKRATSVPVAVSKAKPGDISFVWPVKGNVVKKYSTNAKSPSKGIEISASRGSRIRSAAAGKVIYSSDGIKGYGNLIIIRHDDSYFSVYGYNDKNLVDVGSFVSQNEEIALSGGPADGGEPRVHFEIRYGKNPVDPLRYLP